MEQRKFAVLPTAESMSDNYPKIVPRRYLQYHACYGRFRCARLELPMDWNNPETDNSTVAIAIIRLPAKVEVVDPRYGGAVIFNPGSLISYLSYAVFAPANAFLKVALLCRVCGTPCVQAISTRTQWTPYTDQVPSRTFLTNRVSFSISSASILVELDTARLKFRALKALFRDLSGFFKTLQRVFSEGPGSHLLHDGLDLNHARRPVPTRSTASPNRRSCTI